MNHWYVIQTKPQKENSVTSHFKNAGLEVLNPRIKSFVRGLKPLFPNYVFLRWQLDRAENHHMIKYTRGVNKILGTNGRPIPISDQIIQVIQDRVNPNQIFEQQIFKVGTKIKVKNGILRDLEGVLEKPVSAQGRVAVLIRLYEREMRAVLDCKDVRVM